MSNTSRDTKRPTHAIWMVNGDKDKARWTHVGAAWLHDDQKGVNLKFDAFPMSGRIVVREVTEQDSAENNGGQQ